jgi:hypothetical protein
LARLDRRQRVSGPTGAVVSRGLRRDAGITSTPTSRAGYHVRNGGSGWPSISVDCSDLPEAASDRRRAVELRDHLAGLGWSIDLADDSTILYVSFVPTASAARAAALTAAIRLMQTAPDEAAHGRAKALVIEIAAQLTDKEFDQALQSAERNREEISR